MKKVIGAIIGTVGIVATPVAALSATANAATPAPANNAVSYVSLTGSNANAGTSAAKAYATVQFAIDNTADGGTVHLGAGTYQQSFLINRPVTVEGAVNSKGVPTTAISNYWSRTDTQAGLANSAGLGSSQAYYGTIGIDNLSGTAGDITIENLGVKNPYITQAEGATGVFVPTDISAQQDSAADTILVNNVSLGGATEADPANFSSPSKYNPSDAPSENTDYGSVGFYQIQNQNSAPATQATVENSTASGVSQGFFIEGQSGSSLVVKNDTATELTPIPYQGTSYPAEGVYGAADQAGGGGQSLTVTGSTFSNYSGIGIKTASDSGDVNLTATGNTFDRSGGPGKDAISLNVSAPERLTYTLSGNKGSGSIGLASPGDNFSGPVTDALTGVAGTPLS